MEKDTKDLPALKMWRPDSPLPKVAVPSGFRVRLLRDNEGEDWCRCVLNDMGVDEVSQALFEKQMLNDPNVPKNSIFCVADKEDIPVATATAQFKIDLNAAYLHMVGVREDMRGKGLGFLVNAAAINQHRENGRPECFLTTHDWRLPALKQYVRLGFLPLINHESVRPRWKEILKLLGFDSIDCVDENLLYQEKIISL